VYIDGDDENMMQKAKCNVHMGVPLGVQPIYITFNLQNNKEDVM
jgi:hypothetical protein